MSNKPQNDSDTPRQRPLHVILQRIQKAVADDAGRRIFGTYVALGSMFLGILILLFALGRFVFAERGIGLVTPAVTLLVAGITALVAQMGLSSWAEQRKRDREAATDKQRESIYTQVAQLLVGNFLGTNDLKADADLRAVVAVWGNADVVAAMGSWQKFFTKIRESRDATAEGYKLQPHEQVEARKLVAEALYALRESLQVPDDGVTVEMIIESIFNSKFSANE